MTADHPTSARRKIPLAEQAAEAARELSMRHRVYPGRIKSGAMTEQEAAHFIDLMRAIRDTLRLFAEHEDVVRRAIAIAMRADPAVAAVLEEFPDAEVAVTPTGERP